MPAADTVLLPLCVGLTLIGVLLTGLAWRRGNTARVVQGVGVALAPIALYLSGLLRLVWDGVAAAVGWVSALVFTPSVWLGLALLGVCLVLFVVGNRLVHRKSARGGAEVSDRRGPAAVTTGKPSETRRATAQPKQQAAPMDEEMAEIEALLKSRGIE